MAVPYAALLSKLVRHPRCKLCDRGQRVDICVQETVCWVGARAGLTNTMQRLVDWQQCWRILIIIVKGLATLVDMQEEM